MTPTLLIVIRAALMGACRRRPARRGGAHAAPGAGARQRRPSCCCFTPPRCIGAAAALHQGLLWPSAGARGRDRPVVRGGALFAGDIAMRAFAGHRLFPDGGADRRRFVLDRRSWLRASRLAALVDDIRRAAR